MSNKKFFSLLLVMLFIFILLTGCSTLPENKEETMGPSATPIQPSPENPVMEGADPFVLLYDGVYYLYSTNAVNEGYLVYTSTDMQNWESQGLCLKKEDVKGDYGFWAPEVIYYQEKFYMIYTAEEHLGIAVADSPLGPFTQERKRFFSTTKEIDGHFFLDDDGTLYIYFVRFTDGNVVYGAKMREDMRAYDNATITQLIHVTEDWENKMARVTEGPSMVKHNGTYYLTYSANHYESQDYAVGYATSDSPLAGFTKYEGNPILHGTGDIVGTGHHSFTTSPDKSQLYIVYHRHFSTTSIHPRMTCIDKVYFQTNPAGGPDILVVDGPT